MDSTSFDVPSNSLADELRYELIVRKNTMINEVRLDVGDFDLFSDFVGDTYEVADQVTVLVDQQCGHSILVLHREEMRNSI